MQVRLKALRFAVCWGFLRSLPETWENFHLCLFCHMLQRDLDRFFYFSLFKLNGYEIR